MRAFLLILVITVASGAALGEELSAEERLLRFQLFNSCEPMRIQVEGLSTDAVEIGLAEESLSSLLESRLRAARLYDGGADSSLYVEVNVGGPNFSFDLVYTKNVIDIATGYEFFVGTWELGRMGTHGQNGGYIRQLVSEDLDQFILEYLRVNEASCN